MAKLFLSAVALLLALTFATHVSSVPIELRGSGSGETNDSIAIDVRFVPAPAGGLGRRHRHVVAVSRERLLCAVCLHALVFFSLASFLSLSHSPWLIVDA